MSEIKYEIIKTIGILSEGASGWTKELNLVSWNNKAAKYDIREWSTDHKRMGKGITFSNEEINSLKQLLQETD